MGASQKSVKEFALIGFILLAVLFGMQIMTFIFGSLGTADYLEDVTQSVVNETEAWINSTGYTLSQASQSNFSGGAVITAVWNATDNGDGYYNLTIPSANYTVNSNTGIVTNTTVVDYGNVSISYSTSHKTEAEMTSDEVSNDSLHAIGDYAGQSRTQFTTLGIAITLILLVAVFLFFWKSFMGKKKGEGSPGSFS